VALLYGKTEYPFYAASQQNIDIDLKACF